MSRTSTPLVCFEDGKGFMVYDPNDGSVTHTLEIMKASESDIEDWCDISQRNINTCTLLEKQ